MVVYPESWSAILHHGLRFALRVLTSYTDSIGDTVLGYFAPAVVFLVQLSLAGFGDKAIHGGLGRSFRVAWKTATTRRSVQSYAIVYVLIVSLALGRETWFDHRNNVVGKLNQQATLNEKVSSDVKKITELQHKLDEKVYVPDFRDPQFHLLVGGVQAFMKFRRTIGPDAHCWILTTEPSNNVIEGIGKMSMTVISFAVMASNCPNGNLRNIGVTAKDVEKESQRGMLPGVLVFHALEDAKGAQGLFDDLQGMFKKVKRSYSFPTSVSPSDNIVWLQFGSDVQWREQP